MNFERTYIINITSRKSAARLDQKQHPLEVRARDHSIMYMQILSFLMAGLGEVASTDIINSTTYYL